MRLPIAKPGLASIGGRRVATLPKEALPVYQTPEYRIWRETVIARAGGRCEAIVDGKRCVKAAPRHRMFADHKVEVRDGGALFDPENGRCLCGAHHTAKTAKARAERR